MSRFRYYIQSLVSGYVVIIANILYTLLSVPLALRFLSEAEFGLWALATQIGVYLALVDLGITSALARILIDYKDPINKGGYGSVVKTGIAVNTVQGLIVAVFGVAAAFVLGPLLEVPSSLIHSFRILVIGQCVILSASFIVKIFGQILVAHQRSDVVNCWQSLAFLMSLGVLWLSFKAGAGIYSVIWAQAATTVIGALAACIACIYLRLWPTGEFRGSFDWGKFRELFVFGKDIFLFALGSLLVNSSHIAVISKTLGLEAAAIWSICTRSFTLMGQLVGRVLDFSAAPLSEMLVRGELERLRDRFRAITIVSLCLAIAAGITFASCNEPFVSLWAGSKFAWGVRIDMLLALWFVLLTVQRCHIGLLGISKQLQVAKYVYFVEGASFIILGFILLREFGFSGVVIASIICTTLFTGLYGVRMTSQRFALTWRDLAAGWFAPAAKVVLVMVPIAVGVHLLTEPLTDMARLAARGTVMIFAAGFALWRWALTPDLQNEMIARSPAAVRRIFRIAPLPGVIQK